MMPFYYRLRNGVRFEKDHDNSCLVVSETPLSVIRAHEQVIQVLKLCDGKGTPKQIAMETRLNDEQRIFNICDYFARKGVLEIEPAHSADYYPSVTVIIPTKDRKHELVECLESVFSQDYPRSRTEVIVIDDGSEDGTSDIVAGFPAKLLSHRKSRGQSHCRNLGASEANGEILAFLDSDCVADKAWLKELTLYFQWEGIGAVGGYVGAYFTDSSLDRYEEVCSPLNMGKRFLYGDREDSTFYVPTCNLLVQKRVFLSTGGFEEQMDVGEDVDFCWRLRKQGYRLLYAPYGTVRHRHRNSLLRFLARRADYGTSEAILYNLHPEKKKTFQIPPMAAMSYLLVAACMMLPLPWLLVTVPAPVLLEATRKWLRLRRRKVAVSPVKISFSVVRGHFSFCYFISFHLLRYYLIPLLLSGLLFHPLLVFGICTIALTSTVDYAIKKPRISSYPVFLFYYLLEHCAYQIGVLSGCLKKRSFRSYRPFFFFQSRKSA